MTIFPLDRSAQDILKKMAIEAWPALAVLFLTAVISAFFSGVTFATGMFGLFESHEHLLAVRYITQMVLALYPPFLVLAVVHKYYTEKREHLILTKLKALPIAPIEARELTIA